MVTLIQTLNLEQVLHALIMPSDIRSIVPETTGTFNCADEFGRYFITFVQRPYRYRIENPRKVELAVAYHPDIETDKSRIILFGKLAFYPRPNLPLPDTTKEIRALTEVQNKLTDFNSSFKENSLTFDLERNKDKDFEKFKPVIIDYLLHR